MPDWFPKVVSHLLTGIILVLIIKKMVRKSAVLTKDGSGKILGYSFMFGVLGLIVFSLFTFMAVYSFIYHVDGWQMIAVVGGVLALLGLFILLYAVFTKVEINDSKLISRVFWRAPVTLHWLEVKKVDFLWNKHFRLQGYDDRRIHVDMMIGGLNWLLDGISKHLSVEKYLDAMRDYWKVAQSYHRSVGSVLAIPPADFAKVLGTLSAKDLKDLLERVSGRVEEGFGKKEIEDILQKLKKAKPNQGLELESQVLFRGMPAHFFLFLYVLENGQLQLHLFAPPKLAEMIKIDMEKSGATEVLVELDEDEEDEEEYLEHTGAQ